MYGKLLFGSDRMVIKGNKGFPWYSRTVEGTRAPRNTLS